MLHKIQSANVLLSVRAESLFLPAWLVRTGSLFLPAWLVLHGAPSALDSRPQGWQALWRSGVLSYGRQNSSHFKGENFLKLDRQ